MPKKLAYQESLKQISIIYVAVFLELIIFLGIAVFVITSNNGGKLNNFSLYSQFKTGIVLFFMIDMLLIYFLPKKMINRISEKEDMDSKLIKYRNAYFLKMGLIEILGLSLIVFLFLYGDYVMLVPIAIVFFILISNRPIVKKIGNELVLNGEEKSILESRD